MAEMRDKAKGQGGGGRVSVSLVCKVVHRIRVNTPTCMYSGCKCFGLSTDYSRDPLSSLKTSCTDSTCPTVRNTRRVSLAGCLFDRCTALTFHLIVGSV